MLSFSKVIVGWNTSLTMGLHQETLLQTVRYTYTDAKVLAE